VEENQGLTAALGLRREGENLFDPLVRWIGERLADGCRVLLVARTRVQAQRLSELLRHNGVASDPAAGFGAIETTGSAPLICVGRLSAGFVWTDERLALLTAEEIFGSRRSPRRSVPKPHVHTELLTFEDLSQGDLVVHTDHGIGRYEGLTKLTLNGATNDYLLIGYRDEDKLYLPVDRMNMIQKYLGVDDVVPVLDKMGGKSWERVKEKVKRSVEKIAGELLDLYATRKVGQGHVFDAPDAHYHEFEAGFPYEETTDQLKAIRAVGDDLQRPVPMDRLVCGDVGYGKTEVALRSSFLAVNAGKQVAVLVPTTVLAQQHFATFSERFGRYPVNVACLSRFRSRAEQNQVIEALARGSVDIVIGTHRLLQKDVRFKDLGLVILDEEQRFGVKQKERLKQLRKTVHVLALTATPIPRTLHMSLVGVRDISVISTPPEARQPIETHLCEWDDALIADAIRRELARGGQVFFVHNKVQGIDRMTQHIQALVPEARVDTAHGQMAGDDLETAMLRFLQRETDVLVCTTIIESGLDIPSANTMIINRADTFGLAQIYQLRGRVGRSAQQAYAYLIIARETALTRDAQKRLRVLMEHSDLGSGFQIAMSDLQIRGGGTILGASQSGHIAAVGYDMFLKLMESAVAELKGERLPAPLEPEIHLPLSAYIPEGYIPDIDGRLSLYRRLARLTEPREIADIKSELTDRFGEPPAEVANLLLKILLRQLAIQAGIRKLELSGSMLLLQCSEAHQSNPRAIVDLVLGDPARFEFTADHLLRVHLERDGAGLLTQTKNILKEIRGRVTG
jgi:transcription-repair coupling factor (superfamily II helicase)